MKDEDRFGRTSTVTDGVVLLSPNDLTTSRRKPATRRAFSRVSLQLVLLPISMVLLLNLIRGTGGFSSMGNRASVVAKKPSRRRGCRAFSPFSFQASRLFSASKDPHSCSFNSEISDTSWSGAISTFSQYAKHVRVGKEDAAADGITVTQAISRSIPQHINEHASSTLVQDIKMNDLLSPAHLLQLGAVWYLAKEEFEHNEQVNEEHSLIYRPTRLGAQNSSLTLQEGDYLRIHFHPRRFPNVYDYEWSSDNSSQTTNSVIELVDDDYVVISKPPLVPVHATVDNEVETVIHQLSIHNPQWDYIVPTQRIDVNTSGLLVIATSQKFAAYFGTLLRNKTQNQLQKRQGQNEVDTESTSARETIYKGYTCLVCLGGPEDESVVQGVQNLQALASNGTIVKHYLEPSIRAPKRFEAEIPSHNTTEKESWQECLLKVSKVDADSIYPLQGSPAAEALAASLWPQRDQQPPGVKAMVEVQVQLLTGRTHQIRGQMSKLGYPLVGDELYGGAVSVESLEGEEQPPPPMLLGLYCSSLKFKTPFYRDVFHKKRRKLEPKGYPSSEWKRIEIDNPWWRQHLQDYERSATAGDASATICKNDPALSLSTGEAISSHDDSSIRPDLLPPRAMLSPGKNKYVLVKVLNPLASDERAGEEQFLWFVKSATPKECGGPYHANVAKDLIDWIHAAGYTDTEITGGGRIDYDSSQQTAFVYGFSYGFGKGNHRLAAAVIRKAFDGDIQASHDDSDDLY